jgi:TonB family protein
MNTLNYIIEANIGLALFLVAYLVVLRNETDFKINRLFLLSGIFVSLLFPLFHFQYNVATIPALGNLLPSTLLPEIIITEGDVESISHQPAAHGLLFYFEIAYVIGITFFLVRFIVQLFDLVLTMKRSKVNTHGKLKIVESIEDKPTFSFFNFIFLNHSQSLASHEKEKIILHETIHAKQFHSFDILVLNVINIFFWFNPLIRSYKKIFVQLHEFEADARAVENSDVNEYCSLLAKAALQSADYKLASHFNNSLTLKRIQMIKTIKRKIRPWKMLVIAGMIPVTFFVIACQDQLTNEAAEIAQTSTTISDIPEEVQMKYDQLLEANPDKSFLLMETDENMTPKLEGTKKKYESLHQAQISRIELITPTAKENEGLRTFVIIEYDEDLERAKSQSKLSEKIFSTVEDTATPEGGMGVFFEHVGRKLKYPAQARRMGIEGKVFVEFVVEEDGSITDVKIKKGIGGGCDKEALMVVQTAPKWNPGKIKGIAVKQQIILPITFKLAKEEPTTSKDVTEAPKNSLNEVVAVGYSK